MIDELILSEKQRRNFEAKVDKSLGEDECWLWTGYRISTGYGIVGLGKKIFKAHRVAYRLWVGSIPEGLHILHRCDNPPCCNPAHLRAGTIAENSADKHAKGRANPATGDRHSSRTHPELVPKGSSHGRAKLTEESVIEMRKLYASGSVTLADMSKKFGVSPAVAHFAIKRKTWAHVP